MNQQVRIEVDGRRITVIDECATAENGNVKVLAVETVAKGMRAKPVVRNIRSTYLNAGASVVVWDEKKGDFVGRDHHV
ncbi:MAG: hypothetical protein IPJ61_20270 [Tessaracoccus sp.]|uniref:hypothetical protein n=1 Tax=Tessaracoccus sp. TaxID=1971211 RepID=UPI001ECC2319|nr:hypothetical protein [Tessaracoccus sp.]MBK7823324.1 hypothetical protein [Tessaracoccus sp.]